MHLNQKIYLDHAATTPLAEEVRQAMMPYLKEKYGNPSSIYDFGSDNKKALSESRKSIALTLQCEPQNIYFTSGGTESDNWALVGIAEQYVAGGKHIITSKIEHHAILESCHYLEKLGTGNLEICENTFPVKTQFIYYWTILDKYKLRDFIRYFISLKKLKFNFINGSYSIGMSHIEYILLVSNAFIEWYNKKFNNKEIESSFDVLKSSNLLKECIVDNGKIYNYTKIFKAYSNQLRYIGEKVCTFKGRDITIDITDKNEIEENNNKSIILNKDNAMFILTIILRVLNYRYGRNKAICEYGKFGTEVKYL